MTRNLFVSFIMFLLNTHVLSSTCNEHLLITCMNSEFGDLKKCNGIFKKSTATLQKVSELSHCLKVICDEKNTTPPYCNPLIEKIIPLIPDFAHIQAKQILNKTINIPNKPNEVVVFTEVNKFIEFIKSNDLDINNFKQELTSRYRRWTSKAIESFNQLAFYDRASFFKYFLFSKNILAAETLAKNNDLELFEWLYDKDDLKFQKILMYYKSTHKNKIFRKFYNLLLSSQEIPSNAIQFIISTATLSQQKIILQEVLSDKVHLSNLDIIRKHLRKYGQYFQDRLLLEYDNQDLINIFSNRAHNYTDSKWGQIIQLSNQYYTEEPNKLTVVLNSFIKSHLKRKKIHLLSEQNVKERRQIAMSKMKEKKEEDRLAGKEIIEDHYKINESLYKNPIFHDNRPYILKSLTKHIKSNLQIKEVILHLYSHYPKYPKEELISYLRSIKTIESDVAKIYEPLTKQVFPIAEQVIINLEQFQNTKRLDLVQTIFKFGNSQQILTALLIANENNINIWQFFPKSDPPNVVAWKHALKLYISKVTDLGNFTDKALINGTALLHMTVIESNNLNLINKSLNLVVKERLKYPFDLKQLSQYAKMIQGISGIRAILKIKLKRFIANLQSSLKEDLSDISNFVNIEGPIDAARKIESLKRILTQGKELDLNKVYNSFINIENALQNWNTFEYQKAIEIFDSYIHLVKYAVSKKVFNLNNQKNIFTLYSAIYTKKATTFSNRNLKQNLNGTNSQLKTFMSLISSLTYFKLYFATQTKEQLNSLSRKDLLNFSKLLRDYQKKIAQHLYSERSLDYEQVQTLFLDNNEDYHYTTSSAPIISSLICLTSSACFYDLKYTSNHHVLTNYISIPQAYYSKISYPVKAINEIGNSVRDSLIKNYRPRKLSLSLDANDIVIIDVSINNNIIPEKPLQGFHGRALINQEYQYKVEVCRGWATWFDGKWCLSHKTEERTGIRLIQTMENGSKGRKGEKGISSADVDLYINGIKEDNAFGKVFILNSSGTGGPGADGGKRCGDTCGNTSGAQGIGGLPGSLGSTNIIKNEHGIEVITLGKVGYKGENGKTDL